MKFSIGYQIDERDTLVPAILRHAARVQEVYFAFGDFPNGRHKQTRSSYLLPYEAQERQLADLDRLHKAGIALNLLLNGNCYGADSLSRSFFSKIGDTVDYLASRFSLPSVTTTSPVIAKFLHSNFAGIEVRASVNMAVGTPTAMGYIADSFDTFYLKRDLNRDMAAIRRARAWCDANGKGLFMLANSGCLNECPLHTFHDNLVAHEEELATRDNAFTFESMCGARLSQRKAMVSLLRDSNFVRPEDIALYEGLFTAAKLATRVNPHPVRIIEAYMAGRYIGNLADLLEPDHAARMYPYVLENSEIPPGFAERVLYCDKQCETCGYCERTFEGALKKINEGALIYADKQDD